MFSAAGKQHAGVRDSKGMPFSTAVINCIKYTLFYFKMRVHCRFLGVKVYYIQVHYDIFPDNDVDKKADLCRHVKGLYVKSRFLCSGV